jgi:hypothetical protein
MSVVLGSLAAANSAICYRWLSSIGVENEMSVRRKGKLAMIAMARKANWSDAQILTEVLANEYGPEHRRELVVEWGEYLGLSASDALKLAQSVNLIPTSAPPRSLSRSKEEKPQRKGRETAPE